MHIHSHTSVLRGGTIEKCCDWTFWQTNGSFDIGATTSERDKNRRRIGSRGEIGSQPMNMEQGRRWRWFYCTHRRNKSGRKVQEENHRKGYHCRVSYVCRCRCLCLEQCVSSHYKYLNCLRCNCAPSFHLHLAHFRTHNTFHLSHTVSLLFRFVCFATWISRRCIYCSANCSVFVHALCRQTAADEWTKWKYTLEMADMYE